MKNILLLISATILLAACEAKVETPAAQPAEKNTTTIVNPPAEKTEEKSTTIINPPASKTEEKTTTTTETK